MLQDPRPLSSLQHSVCEVLQQLGVEFLPSQWHTQEALLEPGEDRDLQLLLAYLSACNIPHQTFHLVSPTEFNHLRAGTVAKTSEGQFLALHDHPANQIQAGALQWAVQIESAGPASQHQPVTGTPTSLFSFINTLRNSSWLREAIRFEQGSFKPVVYASLLINILALAGPLFSLQVYDRIIPNQAYASLLALMIGVAICLGFEHALKHARHRLMEIAATSIDTRCTAKLSNSLLNVAIHNTEPTVLLQHLRSFEQLRELITGVFLLALIDLPFLVLFLVVITLIHPLFLLLATGVLAITLWMVLTSHHSLSRLGQNQMRQARETQSQWLDSLSCLDNIQAHGVQQAHAKLLNSLQLKARVVGNAVRDQLYQINQRIHLLQQLGWIFTIALGVYLIVEKQMTVGGLIAVSMLTMRCFAPVQKLQSHLTQAHSAQASFEELDHFLSRQTIQGSTHTALKELKHIQIDSVSVRKPGVSKELATPSNFILHDITLTLPAGMKLGIIGPTGSGKTSVLKLLSQQLKFDEGQISINHLAINHYEPGEIACKVGYATQPPVLIKGSLLDNIRFMRASIDTANCWQILDKLGLKDWVEQHPDGLHMHIESQGHNLSSGQKQAISLCRALAGQPELLLLDEPTVCLDQRMESRLLQTLQELGTNTTLVFTTHKLGLLACANQLALMNMGTVHAVGEKADVLHAANTLAKKHNETAGKNE